MPTKANSVFLGWDENKNATTPTCPKGTTCTFSENRSITLYAIYHTHETNCYHAHVGSETAATGCYGYTSATGYGYGDMGEQYTFNDVTYFPDNGYWIWMTSNQFSANANIGLFLTGRMYMKCDGACGGLGNGSTAIAPFWTSSIVNNKPTNFQQISGWSWSVGNGHTPGQTVFWDCSSGKCLGDSEFAPGNHAVVGVYPLDKIHHSVGIQGTLKFVYRIYPLTCGKTDGQKVCGY